MNVPQSTVPCEESQATVEDFTYGIDCSANLADNQIPVNVTVTLKLAGTPIELVDAPVVVGSVITQRIRAKVLTPSPNYQLWATYSPSGTTNTFLAILEIDCPL